jgi:hypothetical protein
MRKVPVVLSLYRGGGGMRRQINLSIAPALLDVIN